MRTKKNNEIRTTKEGIMVGTKTKDHENGANSVAGRTRRSSFPIVQDSFLPLWRKLMVRVRLAGGYSSPTRATVAVGSLLTLWIRRKALTNRGGIKDRRISS